MQGAAIRRQAACSVVTFALLLIAAMESRALAQFGPTIQDLQRAIQGVPQPQYQPQYPAQQPYLYRPPNTPVYPQNSPYPQQTYRPPAPAPASALPDSSVLASIQRMLGDLGYDAGTADGIWGERSAQALRAFQRDHRQPADGIPTVAVQSAVSAVWARRPAAPPMPQPAQAGDPNAPSFSCASARSPAEHAICNRPNLAALDRQLAEAFAAAQSVAVGAKSTMLAAEQRAWLIRRDACGGSELCLQTAISQRLTELRAAVADAGTRPDNQLPISASADATSLGQDPLAPLVRPPEGLRAWPLDTVGDHLVVSFRNHHRWVNSAESALGDRFFRLLELTSVTGAMEQEADPGFLSGLLDQRASQAVFGSGPPGSANRWNGNNELEQRESRRLFLEVYAPKIRAMAPKPPFLLHWSEPALMGQYDDARGGFPVRPLGLSDDHLSLFESVRSGQLVLAPGFRPLPDLFWKIDRARAEAFLRQHPDRTLEFAASVLVRAIDPVSREVSLETRELGLRVPDSATDLYTYPIAPTTAALAAAPPVLPVATATARGDATANAAEAARNWNLPTRGGLPWIDVQGGDVLRTGMPSDFQYDPLRARAPTPHELWSRAIHAMGIVNAADPGVPNDKDILRLACVFMPATAQTALFRQNACGFQPSRPDAPFALKDGAAAFRAQELPRLRAAAPHLPLRLLLVTPVILDVYDASRAGFRLNLTGLSGSTQPIRLFGSPLDVVLPTFWAATEAEARRYVATQTGQSGSRAWMAVTVTVTGTTPEHGAADISSDTGLPNNATWRLLTDSVVLYLDAGLSSSLHDFSAELGHLPQPIIGTTAEQDPRPYGPLPLDSEAALLLLLHKSPELPAGLSINWSDAATARFNIERELANRPDWKSLDAWGTFFVQAPDPAGIEAYRAWTLRRAANLPDTVAIRRAVSGSPGRLTIADLRVLGNSPVFLNPSQNFAVPGPDYMRQMPGIDPAQLVPLATSLLGSPFVPLYAAVPQAAAAYALQPPAGAPPVIAYEGNPAVVTMAQIAGFDTISVGGRLALVLRLQPTEAEIRQGSRVLLAGRLAGPDWASAEVAKGKAAEAAAAQKAAEDKGREEAQLRQRQTEEAAVRKVATDVLSGIPEGPDIVGLRLGMTMADAERLVREHMTIGRVLTATVGPNQLGPVRIFVNSDKTEQIGLVDQTSGKVLAILRSVSVDKSISNPQLLDALKAKYGSPTEDNTAQGKWQWGQTIRAPCLVPSEMVGKLDIVEGPPTNGPVWGGQVLLDEYVGLSVRWSAETLPSLAELRSCEPKIDIWRTGPDGHLRESLYDARIYGSMAADVAAKAVAKAAPPKL